MTTADDVNRALADAHRHEWAKVLAATVRVAGDIDLAQECAQDTYLSALETWRRDGIPRNPGAWLTTEQIAHAFLVSESTMAARVTRAKKKISGARIPYRVPEAHELPERLDAVLTAVHLVFAAGHTAPTGDSLVRPDLVDQAIELCRVLSELMPDEREARGLLALMMITDARRATRVDTLSTYHYLPAARADFLRRLGREEAAAASYRRALALVENDVERAFLERRLAEQTGPNAKESGGPNAHILS